MTSRYRRRRDLGLCGRCGRPSDSALCQRCKGGAPALTPAQRAAGPQGLARRGSHALVPGICVRYERTPRFSGWIVHASRQARGRQQQRTWTLSAHSLDDALTAAAAWRAPWAGVQPDLLATAARVAVTPELRRRIASGEP